MTFVTVSVEKGLAKLTGTVSSDRDKSLAESLAKIDGITGVDNQITVVPPSPEPTIEAEVAEEPSSLYEEAQLEAERYWNRFIFHCGDSDFIYSHRPADPKAASSYYDKPLDTYYEMRNLIISTDGDIPTPRSEVDRLNEQYSPTGIEWSGSASVSATAIRIYLSQDTADGFTSEGWNRWREESKPLFKVGLSKRNGKWSIDEGQGASRFNSENFKKARCQEIPGNGTSKPTPQIQTPQSQTSQSQTQDLSDTYAKVGNVIYNKKTMTVFTQPSQFFGDSGKTSFNGLRYDVQTQLPLGLKFLDGRKLTDGDYRNLSRKN